MDYGELRSLGMLGWRKSSLAGLDCLAVIVVDSVWHAAAAMQMSMLIAIAGWWTWKISSCSPAQRMSISVMMLSHSHEGVDVLCFFEAM